MSSIQVSIPAEGISRRAAKECSPRASRGKARAEKVQPWKARKKTLHTNILHGMYDGANSASQAKTTQPPAVKPGCALSRYFFKEPAKFVTTVTEGLTCCATLSIRIFLPSGEMSKNTVGADVVIGICCGAPSCGAPSTSLNEIT